jgi:hypothetical protein
MYRGLWKSIDAVAPVYYDSPRRKRQADDSETFSGACRHGRNLADRGPQHNRAGEKASHPNRRDPAHDEELRFKATARRNKLLGLWAAEKLGVTGADADAYAKEVVVADFEESGDDDVLRKVRKDFDAKGVAITDQDIRAKMTELLSQAVAQIQAGT